MKALALGTLIVLLCLLATGCTMAIEPEVAAQADSSAIVAPGESNGAEFALVPVHEFPANEENMIEAATSTLVRQRDRLVATFDTVGLEPGHTYTLWWVVFNNPEACAEAVCGGPDMANPEVATFVGYGGGEIAAEDGTATFHAVLELGDAPGALDNDSNFPFELLEPTPGLADPMGAEVHLAIRTHGAAMDDPTAQLSSFNDGCNPECMNVHAAMHLAGETDTVE